MPRGDPCLFHSTVQYFLMKFKQPYQKIESANKAVFCFFKIFHLLYECVLYRNCIGNYQRTIICTLNHPLTLFYLEIHAQFKDRRIQNTNKGYMKFKTDLCNSTVIYNGWPANLRKQLDYFILFSPGGVDQSRRYCNTGPIRGKGGASP